MPENSNDTIILMQRIMDLQKNIFDEVKGVRADVARQLEIQDKRIDIVSNKLTAVKTEVRVEQRTYAKIFGSILTIANIVVTALVNKFLGVGNGN